MGEPTSSIPSVIDPASRHAIRRFLLSLALFVVWAQVASSRSASSALAIMAVCAAAIDGAIAVFAREPLLGPSLNRWDVAMAFLGVYYFEQILAGAGILAG